MPGPLRLCGSLYDRLLPVTLRQRFEARCVGKYAAAQALALEQAERSAASTDLPSAYLSRLRVVADRNAMLRLLPSGAVAALVGVSERDWIRRVLLIARPATLYVCECEPSRLARPATETTLAEDSNSAPLRWVEPVELQSLGPEALDWLFVELPPAYDSWSKWLEFGATAVRAGGTIAGAGYGGSSGDGQALEPVRAVNGFCIRRGWDFALLSHESHRRLSFAIRRIGG